MNFGFIFILSIITLSSSQSLSERGSASVCDSSLYQQCMDELLSSSLGAVREGITGNTCSDGNITSASQCVLDQLDACGEHFGDVHVATVRPYVRLFENVYTKACQGDYELGDCDVSLSSSCITEFFNILVDGGVTKICKQSSVTLSCLQSSLTTCSDLRRYLVARVADEIKLTSDLLCHPNTCNVDIAGQLLKEGMMMIDYPVSIVMQSSLICRDLQTTLALVTNQTAECSQSDLPSSYWQNYMLLYQFGDNYCEARADNYMLANVPQELLMTVYLATIGPNLWTSAPLFCSLYNETLLMAANYSKVTTMYNENVFTWKYAMETNLDKYTKECHATRMYDCDWTARSGEQGTCDVEAAEECVDLVLLSKLIVEVNVQRTSWQTVCTAAENMLACYQYHIKECGFGSVPYSQSVQEMARLVMQECGQLAVYDRPETCDAQVQECQVGESFMTCNGLADSKDDICQHKEELRDCFKGFTLGCKSTSAIPAQFNLEWRLNGCSHNLSILAEDDVQYLTPCTLQFSYNVYNGIARSSDFSWIMCSAISLYEQCLADKGSPALLALYKSQYPRFSQYAAACSTNTHLPGAQPQTEAPSCQVDTVAAEFVRNTLLFMDAYLISAWDINHRCQFAGNFWRSTLQYKLIGCSVERQALFSDAADFLEGSMHKWFCSRVSYKFSFSPCKTDVVQQCLEDLGSYIYLQQAGTDQCGKLAETYQCLYQNGRTCGNSTQDSILQEVKAIRGLMSGLSCEVPEWCDPANRDVTTDWIEEVCAPEQSCEVYDWKSCVDQYGLDQFCGNSGDVVSCIQEQLSGCDPVQYVMAEYNINQYIFSVQQQTQTVCPFSLETPDSVSQIHSNLQECLYMPFIPQNLQYNQAGICSAITGYGQCVAGLDMDSLPVVWRSVLASNIQRWTKEVYLGCELSENGFVVDPDFDRDDFTGSQCHFDGLTCLQSLLKSSVATSHLLPFAQRQTFVCDAAETNFECVVNKTSGCTDAEERSVLVTARWLIESGNNLGACASGWKTERVCDAAAAMECLTDLGLVLAGDISSQSKTQVCMKALSVQDCVNEKTSSCDLFTRTRVEATYSQVMTLVSRFCTAPPVTTMDMCTVGQLGAMCDVERALVCLVPTQALLLQQSASMEQVCGTIPAMKVCVQQFSSGCDEGTRTMLTQRQLRLSARLQHQCPQMFCEECQARACLKNLYQTLQYQDVHICSAISETQECIEQNAQYCDVSVRQALLQELDLLVGEDRRLCEVTLPSCLHKLTETAYEIMSYNPATGMAAHGPDAQNQTSTGVLYSYQQDVSYLCEQATTAYYCVEHHLEKWDSNRQQVLLQTLHGIGDIVYDKCQGTQLQCYSCANATSNEECNQQSPQTCAPNMQSCGTIVTSNSYLSKGCVSPDVCQSGCYGNTCSYCCQGDFCNQPWNNALIEPSTCQPLSALWCGFQLLSVATQNSTNQTDSCITLRDSISCMITHTQDCQSHRSMAMGVVGRELLTSEAVDTCLTENPQCDCGQCTSLLLLTLASSPFPNTDMFCQSARRVYRNSVSEMDFLQCDSATIHSTAYNLNQASYLLKGVCDLNLEDADCYYNNKVYPHGASFTAIDGCNTCQCTNSKVACTLMFCPPDDNDRCPKIEPDEVGICGFTCNTNDDCNEDQICCATACGGTSCREPAPTNETKCYYNGQSYNRSDTFRSEDDCNFCICEDTAITCSNFTCPSQQNFTANATCNLLDARTCIENADFSYFLARQFQNGDVCSAAAEMLTCIDPLIVSCPDFILADLRMEITVSLDNASSDGCDIEDILQEYNSNTPGSGNLSLAEPCSIENALQCFTTVPQNDTCQDYQSIVDCVSNYTTGCIEMNMAPVLFTLERRIEMLAEDCEIVIPNPGPGPTAAPTPEPTTPGPNTPANGYCSYGDRTRSSGSTFRAIDGCNFCHCNMGNVMCTELSCPYQGDEPSCNMTAVEECIQDSYMAYIVSMATQDGGWQICMSAVQMLHCVEPRTMSCPQNIASQVQQILLYNLNEISSVCNIQQILLAYSQNTSQPGGGLDRQCTMQGAMDCLNGQSDSGDICSSQQSSLRCFYNMSQTCFSSDMTSTLLSLQRYLESTSGCQLEMPPGKDYEHCYYDDMTYNIGDNFMAVDGCNFCFCSSGGVVGCTKMYCGDTTLHNATCDINGIRQCLLTASIPNLVSMATWETGHICLSAAELLRCVEPKVQACSGDVLQLIRTAVWSDVSLVQPYCDVSQLYNNTGNQTMPDTSKPCQLQDAAQCIRVRDGDTACSAYQSMIDCVYQFTAGCLSVDAVPVIYELQKQLEPAARLCDLVTPLMHADAAYPVAQCTLSFATTLDRSLSLGYLLTGRLDGLCADVDSYLTCLRSTQSSTLGRMYASNAVQSVSVLVNMCDTFRDNQERSRVECYSCYGASSMEECDNQPTVTCQPYQVCSVGIQLDPYTGQQAVAKGCADMSWCQAVYGCNQQYMSCIHCCTGNLCNTAGNLTLDTSTTTVRTPPTTPQTTTTRPELESCDLEPVTIFMTAHIVRLINFNFIPLQQRPAICQNFESRLSDLVDDVECLSQTKAQVVSTGQWLTNWTSTVCQQSEDNPIDEGKCYESLQCMEKFGNFTTKTSSCRMLKETMTCLKENSQYCPESEKISINRSIQLLADMDHVICVTNPLDKLPEPECVDLQTVPNRDTACNETAALTCVEHIQKAVYNPFLQQDQFCRLVKLGTQCMKDSTYNCSAEVYNRVAPYAANVLQVAHQVCPDTWCPPSPTCQLDRARTCLDTLEMEAQQAVSQGYVPVDTCLNITRVHHCLMNATESCYAVDRQTVVQRYNTLVQGIASQCRAQAVATQVCYTGFQQGIDALVNFNHLAGSHVVETVVQAEISRLLFGDSNYTYAGLNLPGGLFGGGYAGVGLPGVYSAQSGMNTRPQNPYIRRRRDTHPTTSTENNINGGNNVTVVETPGENYWKDNSTEGIDNKTQAGEPGGNGRDTAGGLPTDPAPEMAQTGMGMDPDLSNIYRLLQAAMNQTQYVDTLLSLMGLSKYDIVARTDPRMLLGVGEHKLDMCDDIEQAYVCLRANLHMSMAPGHQQHMLSTALNLLAGLAQEMCAPQTCFSCRGLDSNELCNTQPIDTCQPLQVCLSMTNEGHISKGCVPALTCEQECKQAGRNGSCYCCSGPMCNQNTGMRADMCDPQKATGCVQNLLHLSIMGDPWANPEQVAMVAKCMMTSTTGCYSSIYYQINDAGTQLMALYEAMNCSATYNQAFCDVPGAVTLATLVSSPYKTVTTLENTCRMFESVVQAYHRSNASCCEKSSHIRLSLLLVYSKLEAFCPMLDLEPVCEEQECEISSPGSQVVHDMCKLMHLPEGMVEGATCNVSQALTACWPTLTLNPMSLCPESMEEMNATYQCLSSNTAGCDEQEKVDVQALLTSYIMLCPPVYMSDMTSEMTSGSRDDMKPRDSMFEQYASVLSCLQPLEHMPSVLATSVDLQQDLCNQLETMSECVRDLDTSLGSLQAPSVMVKLNSLNNAFCMNKKESTIDDADRCPKIESDEVGICGFTCETNDDCNEDQICCATACGGTSCSLPASNGKGEYPPVEECDSEIAVQCFANPCDVVNQTEACPVFADAQCVPNYCGGCFTRFMFRGEDVTDLCNETSVMSSCDLDVISESVGWQLNTVLTMSVMVWHELDMYCSQDSNLEPLQEAIAGCPAVYQEPFAAALAWTQEEMDSICYVHVTTSPCVHPTCDVAMATEVIHSLSYYLRTWSVEEKVFCQKVENVWKTLDCLLGSCDNVTMESVEVMIQELRPLSRCPDLMEQMHCSDGSQESHTTASTMAPPTRGTTSTTRPGPISTGGQGGVTSPSGGQGNRPAGIPNGQGNRPTNVPTGLGTRSTGAPSGTRPTGAPREQGTTPATDSSDREQEARSGCDVEGSKLCLYDVNMPAQNASRSPNYCSDLLSSVMRLSECISTQVSTCDDHAVEESLMYFTDILHQYQGSCSTNMVRQLTRQVRARGCLLPECSYYETHNCIMALTPEGDSCGNYADVAECVELVTDGCSPSQRYINEAQLWSGARSILPTECWPEMTTVDTSDRPLLHYLTQMTENSTLAQYLRGNTTQGISGVCGILTDVLSALEEASQQQGDPAPLKDALTHMAEHATTTLNLICTGQDMVKEREDVSGCDAELPLTILRSHSLDSLFGAVMPQDGKDYVCILENEGWRSYYSYVISQCSEGKQRDFMSVFNMIEMLGRLTGTCSPNVRMCNPGEAVQCIQGLAQTVQKHDDWETDQEYVCRSIEHTRMCIKQSVLGCKPDVQQTIEKTLEPVMCKAASICPVMMEDEQGTSDKTPRKLPVCLAPSDLLSDYGRGCNPNKAVDCLQSVAGLMNNPHSQDVCSHYEEAMRCFMNQISECDNLTIMFGLGQALQVASKMEEKCSTRLQAFCDRDRGDKGCSPSHVHRCFDVVKEALEYGQPEQMCFAKEQVEHCLSLHAGSCPRLTQLFLRTELLSHTYKAWYQMDMSLCQSGPQCAYNYVQYLQSTFEDLQEVAMMRNTSSTQCGEEEDEVVMMESYECRVRLDEVTCMRDNADGLPTEVAELADSAVLNLETLFDTACAVVAGSDLQDAGCDGECLQCYSHGIRLLSYLPLLFTFTTEDGQANSTVLYNEEFCGFYDDWSMEVSGLVDAVYCNGSEWIANWQEQHVAVVDGLYDQYCVRPCNTTHADLCVETLQNYSGNESCLMYEAAQDCLNASIYYCADNVTAYYTQQLNNVLIDQGYRCYSLPTFSATTSGVLVEGTPFSVNVTMDEVLAEQCIGAECLIQISLVFDDPDTTSCSSGESIDQILTNQCQVMYEADVSGVTNTFMLYSRLDHKVQPTRNVNLTLMARLLEDGEVFIEGAASQMTFTVENRDTSEQCSLIAEPTITTFDGLDYMSFSKGEFVLYEHTSLPEKVHVRFQSCGGALTACPCAAMVQSGDDVYVLDACRRIGQDSQPLTFRIYRNGDYTPHTQVYYDFDALSNQFVLPSGSIVYVRSDGGENLDIWIHPSALNWNSTIGLCGTYDGESNSDFTYPNGTVEKQGDIRVWQGSLLPFDFVRAWKVDNTLLYGVPADDGATDFRNNTLCQCVSDAGECQGTDLVETCDFVTGVDYSDFLSLHEEEQASARRRKRQAVNEFDETEIDISQLPDWPTASNITEAAAIQYCVTTIEAAVFWEVCSQVTNTTYLVSMCKDRILLSDSYLSVTTTLESLKIQCRTAIISDPSLSEYLNMTYEVLVPYVFNLTCNLDCSDNGQCVNGQCVCNPGYTLDDCSVMLDLSPALSSLSTSLYTVDGSSGTTDVSQDVEILGSGFINSNSLTCHIQPVQLTSDGYTTIGSEMTQPATFLTGDSVRCSVTGSLPLTGLLLSVSNNGGNKSNSQLYIIQDTVCYDCNSTGGYCDMKPTSCVIDNRCYAGSQRNPDDDCYICNPFNNVWGYKISASCPALSTTSTSTASPNATSPAVSTSSTTSQRSSTASPASTTKSPSSSSTNSASTTSSASTTKSASTTSSASAATSSTPQASSTSTTDPNAEGNSSDQMGDDNNDQTVLIIAVSVAGVLVVVIICLIICYTYRLKRRGANRMDDSVSTADSQSSADLVKARIGGSYLQGRLNPYFKEVEYATAVSQDQPAIPRRAAPTRSAPFNPESFLVTHPVRSTPEHDINIGMFEADHQKGKESKATHVWEPVGYQIPRPHVEAEYDNAGRKSPNKLGRSDTDNQYEKDYTKL